MTRLNLVIILLISIMVLMGCGKPGGTITMPDLDSRDAKADSVSPSRVLWGMWDCELNTETGSFDLRPLRTAKFTANVNNLLESKPGNLIIDALDLADLMTEGKVNCTVTLRHPFPGLDQYMGFDVWGVFMHDGDTSMVSDPDLMYASDNSQGGILLNADGYTRWYNWTEFAGGGIPLFDFYGGKLANLPTPTATLNGYKIFADDLDYDEDYYSWVTYSGNADNRGVFSAGITNSREYQLQFPMPGGVPDVKFQYAVIATWEPADPASTGNPSIYEPSDFPTSANCEEAFYIHQDSSDSDLYYESPSVKSLSENSNGIMQNN